MSARISAGSGQGRSRAQYIQREIHQQDRLFTFLKLVFESRELREVSESGLLKV